MQRSHTWKALVAATTGVLLLTGPTSTLARWTEQRPLSGSVVRAGDLGVKAAAPTYRLTRTDLVAGATSMSDVATTTTVLDPATTPLVPGDQVTVSTVVTLSVHGRNNRAVLRVTPGTLTGSSDLVGELAATATGVTLTPVGDAPVLPPAGPNAWSATTAADGAQYVVSLVLTLRPTTDGAPRSSAGTTNWWGTTLEGSTLDARTLGVTLDQVL